MVEGVDRAGSVPGSEQSSASPGVQPSGLGAEGQSFIDHCQGAIMLADGQEAPGRPEAVIVVVGALLKLAANLCEEGGDFQSARLQRARFALNARGLGIACVHSLLDQLGADRIGPRKVARESQGLAGPALEGRIDAQGASGLLGQRGLPIHLEVVDLAQSRHDRGRLGVQRLLHEGECSFDEPLRILGEARVPVHELRLRPVAIDRGVQHIEPGVDVLLNVERARDADGLEGDECRAQKFGLGRVGRLRVLVARALLARGAACAGAEGAARDHGHRVSLLGEIRMCPGGRDALPLANAATRILEIHGLHALWTSCPRGEAQARAGFVIDQAGSKRRLGVLPADLDGDLVPALREVDLDRMPIRTKVVKAERFVHRLAVPPNA